MDAFKKKADESEKSTGSLDDALRALSPSALFAVAGVTALVGTLKSLINVGSNIINVTSQFEQTQKSLETVLQSAEKGKELFEDLRKFSFDTTFGVDELANASSQLLNAGESVSKLQGDLKMLGDLAQGDKNKFQELTSIFAKIQNTGRATSMQLQQLALRGIPIQKTLKEMGVTGVASAEQLTQAFEKLTAEGGQFHDAMNNIIDTIEGKKGFITDTIKEIYVNFGELTGITDTYKETLDFVYNVLDTINNKLMEWNENPMTKAIISGVFTTAITALVTVIGVSLVGALNTVIVKLGIIATLKSFITGPLGIIGLATAGIAGLVGGIASYSRSLKDAEKDLESLNNKIKENKRLANEYMNPEQGSRENQLSQAQKDLETYKTSKANIEKKLSDAKKKLAEYKKATIGLEETYDPLLATYVKVSDRTAELQEEVDKWTKSLGSADYFIDLTTKQINRLNDAIKAFGDRNALEEVFNNVYTEISKDVAETETLENQLKQLQLYRAMEGKYDNSGQLVFFDSKTKQAIDDSIRYLENKLKGVSAWEDIFKNVTGIAVPKEGTKDKSRGQIAGEDYKARMDKLYEAQVKAQVALGGKQEEVSKSVAVKFVNTIEKQIEELLSNIDVDSPFEETDATIKALNAELEKYKEIVGEVAQEQQSLGGYALEQTMSKISGDAGTFINTFMQTGNVFMALISTIIGALFNVLQEVDGFEETLSPVTKLFRQLKPALEMIVEEVQYAEDTMETVLKPLMGIINVIFTLLKPLSEIINRFIRVLFTAFGFFDLLCDMFEKLGLLTQEENEAKKDEIARLNALNNAYKNMLSTLKEVQEEYEHRRKQINAQTYGESVSQVHDMILTPQGKFSTDPNDYIIATKNPSGLNGGINQNVIINNYTSDNVETTTDDSGNLIVKISQKVAYDYAQGNNGWDNAVLARQVRVAGRNVSM